MVDARIVMTQGRFKSLSAELERLKRQVEMETAVTSRHSGVETVLAGAGQPAEETGFQNLMERIRELEEKVFRADVVAPLNRERVFFGAVVRVMDLDRRKVREFCLVGPEEVDPENGRISSASPIGRALMGRNLGDVLAIPVPKGEIRLEILDFF